MTDDENITIEVPTDADVEICEESAKDKFRRWMQDNITSCLVVESELAKMAETCNALQVRPDILYMHLKVMQKVIEEQVFKTEKGEVSEEWRIRKKDADDIIDHILAESMNVHDLLKKYMKDEKKKQYLQGYN
jgi:hypothetical protein